MDFQVSTFDRVVGDFFEEHEKGEVPEVLLGHINDVGGVKNVGEIFFGSLVLIYQQLNLFDFEP